MRRKDRPEDLATAMIDGVARHALLLGALALATPKTADRGYDQTDTPKVHLTAEAQQIQKSTDELSALISQVVDWIDPDENRG